MGELQRSERSLSSIKQSNNIDKLRRFVSSRLCCEWNARREVGLQLCGARRYLGDGLVSSKREGKKICNKCY